LGGQLGRVRTRCGHRYVFRSGATLPMSLRRLRTLALRARSPSCNGRISSRRPWRAGAGWFRPPPSCGRSAARVREAATPAAPRRR
jgi:hypothetical protein